MTELVPYLVVAWVVVMLGAFPSFAEPRQAVLFVFLLGTLFLPEAMRDHVALGPLHFTKYHAISYAVLFGALLYDSERLLSGRPRWFDIPMLVWCLCPLPSVLTNDPPPDGSSAIRDAISQTWTQIIGYGIPYLMGRVYFSDRTALRDLALGIVIAAGVYVPLCLYEIRMSPQLHGMVYGYSQHSFGQTIRFGGYRPMVFLQHGLALGMFMVSASLIAVWLRRADALRPAGGNASRTSDYLGYLPLLLVTTTVLVKSTGAIILGLTGGLTLWLGRATNGRAWLLLLVALPVAYVTARATGLWSGEALVEAADNYIGPERAESLEFRLTNENLLIRKALDRPAFGWGGWGRNRVFNERGQDETVTDGLWVIVLGDRGLVGLTALGVVLLLPVVRLAFSLPPVEWSNRAVAPAAACAVVLALWTIDSLFNAMLLPIYLIMAGALGHFDPDDTRGSDGPLLA